MILRHLSWRGWLMLAACVFLIAGQVYLDLRIPEYMGIITDHLQAGTATEIVASDGARMVACALLSLLLAACTAVLAARVSADLCHTLRMRLFASVGAFSRQDVDGFSASSLITRSTNDVYQIQQFLPRAINMVVKAPMIGVMAVWKIISSRRICEVIDHIPSVSDPAEPAVTEPRGRVEFRDVTFRYPGTDRDVLSGVSFVAEPGETVAIIGPTASGKSTLVSLIPRLYDVTSGSILVDGADVRSYTFEELNSRLGYVPQTAVVFSGTVRDNVNYGGGSGSRDDGDVERALRVAQLWDFVSGLPDGLDTDLAQHGWSLSGGQRQRLAIARAVCRDPGVYLFDDTFSALDYRTDRDIREALDRETSGATRIVVAQRVGTIMDADRIVVLDGGHVVGIGTHGELMDTCPLYREIAESQTEASDARR